MAYTPEQAAFYLAAMIDGEGWVGEPRGAQNRAIRIANTDRDLIDAMVECCAALGIDCRVYAYRPARADWSPGWTVQVWGQKNLQRVLDTVPIRCTRKRDRLARTVVSYRTELDAAEVSRLYYDEGLTHQEVAARLGVGVKRVRNLMRREGLVGRQGSDRSASIWRTRRLNASDGVPFDG
jgi:hypothetical protein